ncbi:MAG: hypothetical protein IPQ05_14190 [Leptospiraceae bacterium]|nr:hypothetical protein [Leptospiraceae bacterium]
MKNIILLFLLSATYVWSEPLQVGEELTLLQYETDEMRRLQSRRELALLYLQAKWKQVKLLAEVFEIGGKIT